MSAPYELRPTLPSDAEALNALYRKVTGIDRSIAAWSWEWREGPEGPAPSWVMVERASGLVVGHHGVVPVGLMLGKRRLHAARTENSMVDPDHRKRLIYSAYEAKLLKELLGQFDLIFTTAGGGAQGAVRQRLGYIECGRWHTLSPGWSAGYWAERTGGATRMLGPLATLLEPRMPRGVTVDETDDLATIAGVCAQAVPGERIVPDRSAEWLDWRIRRHPFTHYRACIFRQDGRPVGSAIWRAPDVKSSARIVTLEDIIAVDGTVATIRLLLKALAAHHRGQAARILVRTLDDSSSLARAARDLTPGWALKGGAGSPVWVRSRHEELTKAPWELTLLLTQGY